MFWISDTPIDEGILLFDLNGVWIFNLFALKINLMRGFELFKLTQFNHMSEVKIHDSHQKYGYSIYIFFFYKIFFIITPKIVLNLNIGCIFFNLSECEEYLYIHWLTPDYLNVYMCPWQPTLHVLSQWLSTEIFPLSCFIKCCYPHTHTHTHTHHTMGITSINISGEQLIYNL